MSEEYKGYKIDNDGHFSMKVIKPIGKGSIPMALVGLFTSVGDARRAIDLLDYKPKRVNKNAETKQRP